VSSATLALAILGCKPGDAVNEACAPFPVGTYTFVSECVCVWGVVVARLPRTDPRGTAAGAGDFGFEVLASDSAGGARPPRTAPPGTAATANDFGFKVLTSDSAGECETSQDRARGIAAAASDFGFKVPTSDSDSAGGCETSQDRAQELRPLLATSASRLHIFRLFICTLTSDAAEQVCETSQDQPPGTATASRSARPPRTRLSGTAATASDVGFKVLTSDLIGWSRVRGLPGPRPRGCGRCERLRLQGTDLRSDRRSRSARPPRTRPQELRPLLATSASRLHIYFYLYVR